jgi:REP element-mobilizing transposase RayT
MNKPPTISFSRRKLPHWRVAGRPYFVTFRLKNTLPEHIVEDLKQQRSTLKEKHAAPEDILSFERTSFIKIENILDNLDNDICYLKLPAAADIVIESFDFIQIKYKWYFPYIVVMPNHVHCLAAHQDNAACSLEQALGYIKSFSAKNINLLINNKGNIWETENFDHWCRTPESEERIKEYIRNNPVKAGLVKAPEDWKWLKIDK